jgi:hypothetical protein
MTLIVGLILAWSVLAVSAFGLIADWPWPLHALYFLVAGIAWILPLKPLLRWMQTGRWRA